MVFWHTDAIRRIGQSLGFIPCSEIIWSKDEISGRRQGFGSPNTRSVRPNHEYIIVMRKDCNRIEGDFGEDDGECYDYCVSCWDDKQLAELSNGERSKFLTNVWDIETARDNPHREFPHPATFPVTLAYGVVKLFVPEDGVIIDPWNGIGTTCAAALLANRRFIGIDIEPYFCEEATAKVERTIKELPRLREKLQQRLNKRLLNALNIAPTSSTAS
jgi:site-specific DNA-methyltransferase (adenine-specific)